MTQEQRTRAEARKARSIEILKREGIPYIQHLPLIEPEGVARLRSQEEIAGRAACTFLSTVCAWNILEAGEEHQKDAAGHYKEIAESWSLWEDLSGEEKRLLSGEGSERTIRTASWRMEAFAVLAWALGMLPELDLPRGQFQEDLEKFFPDIRPDAFQRFAARAQKRPDGEILDQADLIYRIRWAIVEATIHGEPAPAGIDSDVAMERHTALNWLIGYGGDDWDNISLDT